jgi:hypothetical protein
MTHLALRLTTRSEARNTHTSCFTSNSEVRSNDSSCFTSNSEVRSKEYTQHLALRLTSQKRSEAMTHLALRLTARSEARNTYILPLSGRVLSDYTKLISKVFKLYTR